VGQGVGPEFKPQYHKKEKKETGVNGIDFLEKKKNQQFSQKPV
jgi:hypothetical protein